MQNTLELMKHLKGGVTQCGKFYPTNYMVAIFDSPEICQEAVTRLKEASWSDDNLLVGTWRKMGWQDFTPEAAPSRIVEKL